MRCQKTPYRIGLRLAARLVWIPACLPARQAQAGMTGWGGD